MSAKTTACRILDTLNIPYTLREYDWDEDALDAVTVAGKVGLRPEQMYKTLVLRGDKTGLLVACIPGNAELNLKKLSSISGNKKVEMAAVKDLQALTGYIRGGVSPLGMKKKYPTYLDESILGQPDIVSISAGRRGLQIFLKGDSLVQAANATLADICVSRMSE